MNMPVECKWDPSKHDGQPCPIHGAGGGQNQPDFDDDYEEEFNNNEDLSDEGMSQKEINEKSANEGFTLKDKKSGKYVAARNGVLYLTDSDKDHPHRYTNKKDAMRDIALILDRNPEDFDFGDNDEGLTKEINEKLKFLPKKSENLDGSQGLDELDIPQGFVTRISKNQFKQYVKLSDEDKQKLHKQGYLKNYHGYDIEEVDGKDEYRIWKLGK